MQKSFQRARYAVTALLCIEPARQREVSLYKLTVDKSYDDGSFCCPVEDCQWMGMLQRSCYVWRWYWTCDHLFYIISSWALKRWNLCHVLLLQCRRVGGLTSSHSMQYETSQQNLSNFIAQIAFQKGYQETEITTSACTHIGSDMHANLACKPSLSDSAASVVHWTPCICKVFRAGLNAIAGSPCWNTWSARSSRHFKGRQVW